MATCRDCHATIRFVDMVVADGRTRPVPVDPTGTHHLGTIAAKLVGSRLTGYRLSKARGIEPGHLRYVPHSQTCHPRTATVTAADRRPSLFDRAP